MTVSVATGKFGRQVGVGGARQERCGVGGAGGGVVVGREERGDRETIKRGGKSGRGGERRMVRLMELETLRLFQGCDVTWLHDTGWIASGAVTARGTHGSGTLGGARGVSTESISLCRR